MEKVRNIVVYIENTQQKTYPAKQFAINGVRNPSLGEQPNVVVYSFELKTF
jgi:hypothetical protein